MITVDSVLKDTESKMKKAVEAAHRELQTVRTGRASSTLVEGIMVDYYNTKTPLKQLAAINVPESRLIVIQPWDAAVIGEIEKAILKSDLGITPNSDGKLIRIGIPPLTQERREDLSKVVKRLAEEGRVSIRTVRRDANEHLKKIEKDGHISEDDMFKAHKDVQKQTDKYIVEIDKLLESKEKELQEI